MIAATWDWRAHPGLPLRAATSADTPTLASIYRAAIEGTGARYYSPEQVRAWLSLAPMPDELLAMTLDDRLRLVATDKQDLPVGFIDLKPDGHLHYLYVHPKASGTGLGDVLLSAAIAAATRRKLDCVHAEASEAALRCFLRHGFMQKARRDLSVSGVSIHNYSVELRLQSSSGELDAP